ncbi:MAG: hypothetical protein JNL33_11485 [Betaproteobacteria bacterium]|nr:hypothetical protein [Betaproteobacteria bacterium]MBL8534463.1 hypothetical protein [Betaproteobacteria bacterium]
MRINAPSPPVFTVPDTVPVADVGTVGPVNPISEDEPRRRWPGQETAASSPAPAVEEAVTEERRNEDDRRAKDRRKRQLPVLIDTRSGRDRRAIARREEDESPPAGVDVKA